MSDAFLRAEAETKRAERMLAGWREQDESRHYSARSALSLKNRASQSATSMRPQSNTSEEESRSYSQNTLDLTGNEPFKKMEAVVGRLSQTSQQQSYGRLKQSMMMQNSQSRETPAFKSHALSS